MPSKPRIAVVSPFVDRQHGTERCLAEQLERLASVYEIHLYSSRVQDLNLDGIRWHRVPAIGGPELFSYTWFFAANHFVRWRDKTFRHIVPELLYSPGINCADADAISIHIVFGELRRRLRQELRLNSNSVWQWPRLMHRKTYYALAALLERSIYSRSDTLLVIPSQRVATIVQRDFHRRDNTIVIYHGCDTLRFNPDVRDKLRESARQSLSLRADQVAVLLIGNDWRNKGLGRLIEAVAKSGATNICILAVGKDDPVPYFSLIERANLKDRVFFLPPRTDVEFYYAAADIYAGPSAEDAFSLPPLEAMACGLPVITSRNAGVSEIIRHAADGFILEDVANSEELFQLLEPLTRDSALRNRIGKAAFQTASQYTWDWNASQLINSLEIVRRKLGGQSLDLAQSSPASG